MIVAHHPAATDSSTIAVPKSLIVIFESERNSKKRDFIFNPDNFSHALSENQSANNAMIKVMLKNI
jgi:hypothetical protein